MIWCEARLPQRWPCSGRGGSQCLATESPATSPASLVRRDDARCPAGTSGGPQEGVCRLRDLNSRPTVYKGRQPVEHKSQGIESIGIGRVALVAKCTTKHDRAGSDGTKVPQPTVYFLAAARVPRTIPQPGFIRDELSSRHAEHRAEGSKARLSTILDDAVRGRPSVITRRGKREAVLLSYEEWEQVSKVPSFGRLLMSAPLGDGDVPLRSRAPLRDAEH
jgi:antitoxin Phd